MSETKEGQLINAQLKTPVEFGNCWESELHLLEFFLGLRQDPTHIKY